MVNTVQSSYSENMRVGLPGLCVGSDWNADTGICETAAGIGFGLAVGQGAADKGVILGASSVANFRGISVRDVTLENQQLDKYAEHQNVGVITRGKVWVTALAAVVAGDDVYVTTATGRLGTASGGGIVGPIKGARWASSAGADELALVELSGYQGA